MHIEKSETTLTVHLSGEIDHHTAEGIRNKIDTILFKENPKELILDFSAVSFMDSSGVGLVMGRYKKAQSLGCVTTVTGLNARDKRILLMSGMQNKIEFR